MKSLTTFSKDTLQTLARTPRESKEALIEALSEKAYRHFGTYCKHVDRSYLTPDHLKLLHKKLEDVESGKTKRLMIFMPPRHGKSETISRKFPSWYLGRNPDKNIIISSYAHQLATSFSREARGYIESRQYKTVFNIATAIDSRAVNDWNIQGHKGGMMAAGVGGATTGYGADLFIIDDPFKNKEEADSETIREKVWDWYRSVALTRLEPGGAMIIVMTRWHKQDLAGKILEEDKEWEVLNLSAIAEEPNETNNFEEDPLGRLAGDALWPERYNEKALASIKYRVGSRIWNAMFQGHPMDPESQIFRREWFQWYRELPLEFDRYGGIDTATSKKTAADNMALVDICKDWEGYLYVDDVFLEKISVYAFAKHVNAQHGAKNYVRIRLESNNAGEAVKQRIDEVGREKDTGTAPPVSAHATSTDKVVRANGFAHLIENGTIKFKMGNPKVAALVDHLVNFDGKGSDVDDDVDGLGFAVSSAIGGGAFFSSTEDFEVYRKG